MNFFTKLRLHFGFLTARERLDIVKRDRASIEIRAANRRADTERIQQLFDKVDENNPFKKRLTAQLLQAREAEAELDHQLHTLDTMISNIETKIKKA